MKRLVIKRERLYDLIWKEPMDKICEKYPISKKELKEACEYLEVPIPSIWYWKKYETGKSYQKLNFQNITEKKNI